MRCEIRDARCAMRVFFFNYHDNLMLTFALPCSSSNGEMVNYSNIAADCGVSAPTVKEYFQILLDTLTGHFLPSYQKKPKRRVILAPKFYYFDVGITNYLLKRGSIAQGGESFGKAFEQFLFQEIHAHSSYSGLHYPVSNDPHPRKLGNIMVLPWRLFLQRIWGGEVMQ